MGCDNQRVHCSSATPRRSVGETLNTKSVSNAATELLQRLPLENHQQYDFVFENDLAGRAALAVLWRHRQQLELSLVTDEPADRSILALQSAILAVRNPPRIRLVSAAEAIELARTSTRLVWALLHHRTSPAVYAALNRRNKDTFVPYAVPLAALGDQHPDQTDTAHELLLRDTIRECAGFLNFFGDRYNPFNLYERSQFPRWFTPPPEFNPVLPPLGYATIAPDGTRLDGGEFTGSLQLATQHVRTDHRIQIDLGPMLECCDIGSYDATVQLNNEYSDPAGSGVLAIEVHHNYKRYARWDVATTPAQLQLPIRAVRSGDTLLVAVTALRDNPKPSWSQASRTNINLHIHPRGTHRVPNIVTRAKSWLHRARSSQGS